LALSSGKSPFPALTKWILANPLSIRTATLPHNLINDQIPHYASGILHTDSYLRAFPPESTITTSTALATLPIWILVKSIIYLLYAPRSHRHNPTSTRILALYLQYSAYLPYLGLSLWEAP
jgi:hypothetical protein